MVAGTISMVAGTIFTGAEKACMRARSISRGAGKGSVGTGSIAIL